MLRQTKTKETVNETEGKEELEESWFWCKPRFGNFAIRAWMFCSHTVMRRHKASQHPLWLRTASIKNPGVKAHIRFSTATSRNRPSNRWITKLLLELELLKKHVSCLSISLLISTVIPVFGHGRQCGYCVITSSTSRQNSRISLCCKIHELLSASQKWNWGFYGNRPQVSLQSPHFVFLSLTK